VSDNRATGVKQFRANIEMSGEFYRDNPDRAAQMAYDDLEEKLHREDLRGPRGGRYVAVSAPYGFIHEYLFDRDQRLFAMFVDAKYVRPKR
jgi:hypothetical protein